MRQMATVSAEHLDLNDELTIVGSPNSMKRFDAAVELVRHEHHRIGRRVSYRFAMEDAAEPFDLAIGSPGKVEKVVIDVASR